MSDTRAQVENWTSFRLEVITLDCVVTVRFTVRIESECERTRVGSCSRSVVEIDFRVEETETMLQGQQKCMHFGTPEEG